MCVCIHTCILGILQVVLLFFGRLCLPFEGTVIFRSNHLSDKAEKEFWVKFSLALSVRSQEVRHELDAVLTLDGPLARLRRQTHIAFQERPARSLEQEAGGLNSSSGCALNLLCGPGQVPFPLWASTLEKLSLV